MKNLIVIKNYAFLWQAELAKNLLTTHEISCIIQPKTIGASGYPLGGNMDILVTSENAVQAKKILESYNTN